MDEIVADNFLKKEVVGRAIDPEVIQIALAWDELFGMVNVEAMAAGTPVVAFARGGIPEAIGDAGILVDECSTLALGTAICDLLREAELRKVLRSRGLQRARSMFDWSVIADQWKTVVTGCENDWVEHP